MKTYASCGLGRYLANEKDLQIWPRCMPPVRHGIIAFHGRSSDALQWSPGWMVGDHAQVLGDAGMIVLSIDGGGPAVYGNNTAIAAATAAYNYLTGTMGCTAKVGLQAWSMGALAALNWLKANPLKVAGVQLVAPATNLATLHANAAYTAEIDTAYGGNYAANSVGHDPAAEPATWRGMPQVRMIHGVDDTTIAVAASRTFRDAVANPSVELVEVAGDHTTVFSYRPTQATVDFFRGAAW